MIAIDRTGARQGRTRPGRLPGGWLLAAGAVAFLLLSALAARGITPLGGRAQGGQPAAAAQRIDPRLILRPRTLTQAATVGGLRLALTVGPLIPGPNRFELRLTARGLLGGAAHVHMAALMTEMAMPPIRLSMREVQRGRYVAVGPLAMFGRWQLSIQIDRSGTEPLTHRFMIGVDLPRGLLSS
jgi:hypothetical protein